MPDKFINLLPPEITKAKVSGGSQPAIPVPSSAVPKFDKPDLLIPDNFWSNLRQFLIERPIKVRERADAPFTKTSFGGGMGDNFKEFFSSTPAPKGPVNSRLAVLSSIHWPRYPVALRSNASTFGHLIGDRVWPTDCSRLWSNMRSSYRTSGCISIQKTISTTRFVSTTGMATNAVAATTAILRQQSSCAKDSRMFQR